MTDQRSAPDRRQEIATPAVLDSRPSTGCPWQLVLMFWYVFGASIHIPGVSYTNYLMAGIFVQTVIFGAQR